MSATFEARYPGRCGSCDDRIREGDQVRYDEDDLVHADCEASAPVERPVTVCTACWLTMPCDCEEAA